MGRPSTYTQEIADEICARLSKGEPLTIICSGDGMPCDDTVRNWAAADDAFSRDIARARLMGHDAIAWEAKTIADTPVEGVETIEKPDGSVETRRGDMLGHRKLQIETRLKLLAKWDPKRYGDKVETTLQGPGGGPIETKSTVNISPQEAYQRMANGQ